MVRRAKKRRPLPPAADEFKRRLVRAMEVGHLTVADLQHWFERSYFTVYSWIHMGKVPRPGFRNDDVEHRLKLLEKNLLHREGFPIPTSMSQRLRADHMRKVYKDAIAASTRRVVRRSGGDTLRRRD